MIDPNTGQTAISADEIGQLGRALLQAKHSDMLSGLPDLVKMYMKMQQTPQGYSGPFAAPNLTNNLPDVSGQIMGWQ